MFYLAEYCPRAAPAQILSGESERKKEGRKEKLIYMYQGMWIRYEEKGPGCLKVSKERREKEKVRRNLKCPVPNRKWEKKGEEERIEKTEVKGWVNTS